MSDDKTTEQKKAEECAVMIAALSNGADCGAALKDYEKLMSEYNSKSNP